MRSKSLSHSPLTSPWHHWAFPNWDRYTLALSIPVAAAVLGYLYADSLVYLFRFWTGNDDYSHGVFVPLISLFLVWQTRHRIVEAGIKSSWWGVAVIAAGFLLYVIGELSTLYVLLHFSLWLVIVGLVISLIGMRGARAMAFPLSYLLTAIPMPNFFYAGLSSKLQLWSSALGVGCLQLIGITAFREGNVIDLGPVQLQVVEACSGIRYLLPLATLALLCAYLFKDRMWKRIVLVVSSIPISILVNGLRIGVIGVLVENYGQGAAEGFYHLFEGWVLFMASLGMLIFEMWWLSTIGSKHKGASFLDRFTWTSSSLPPQTSNGHASSVPSASSSSFLPSAYFFSVAMLIPFSLSTSVFVEREELSPPRTDFVDFPMALHGWQGEPIALELRYIDQLRFDDYVLAEYRNGKGEPVNFYSAYYRSQKKGQSAHSPQSCLPGGGWEIASLASIELRSTTATGAPLRVNRAVIQKDREKQVLFYWFKQRERNVTSEYLVKFYMLWDALFRNRTDGALVRITSLVGSGETEAQADQRLREFAAIVEPELTKYVPD